MTTPSGKQTTECLHMRLFYVAEPLCALFPSLPSHLSRHAHTSFTLSMHSTRPLPPLLLPPFALHPSPPPPIEHLHLSPRACRHDFMHVHMHRLTLSRACARRHTCPDCSGFGTVTWERRLGPRDDAHCQNPIADWTRKSKSRSTCYRCQVDTRTRAHVCARALSHAHVCSRVVLGRVACV